MIELGVRDYVDSRVSELHTHLDEQTAYERELWQAAMEARAQALVIQAREYERRLEALNHSHQQMRDQAATFVSKETYQLADRDDRAWKASVAAQLSEMKGASSRQMAIFVVIVAILGLAFRFLPL